MRKAICLTVVGMMFCATVAAQSVTANQNQQIINVNVPTIEKKVYVEKYRTVYVEKPRVARKLDAPVKLLGFLWVYPEDIGNFNNVPVDVLLNINSAKPYGRSDWRMPTPDELSILENNADAIGLGDGIYLATDHRNGILRLVATDNVDYSQCVRIGNTYWAKTNFGTPKESETGRPLTYQEAVDKAPAGYRLPTEDEALTFIYSGVVAIGSLYGDRVRGAVISLPSKWDGNHYYEANYWVQGEKVVRFRETHTDGHVAEPYITTMNPETKCFVRYVLDK